MKMTRNLSASGKKAFYAALRDACEIKRSFPLDFTLKKRYKETSASALPDSEDNI